MRHVVIVGAGQAGSLLALGLLAEGYRVTMVSERTAEEIETGRILSNQCVFEPALRHERALGLNHWDDVVPPVVGIAFDAGMPGAQDPFISWVSPLDEPAQSVDQRLKMSFWLNEFVARGGELRTHKATPEDLADYTREADLVLVAAGRGPQFDGIFPRDDNRSPYTEPQRGISLHLVKHKTDFYQGVTFGLVPGVGEFFVLPVLTADGPRMGLYFSAIPGGPMDVFTGVTDHNQHLELCQEQLRRFFPWSTAAAEGAESGGPLEFLTGRIAPVVRHGVGRLPTGEHVLAMGDTAITNDPIAGQGANNAVHCARIYQQLILAHGDRPFDADFMQNCFDRYWDYAQHSTRFNNDLLAPPPVHILETLQAAQEHPEVAHRFAHLFNDPTDYVPWLGDEETARTYLREVAARVA
ncbi:styrene monooxygenase/indole monooxygenase family protein [Kutzneria sp. 744]|uniref:styrene monooxygenase/indole monooxygenase family protein n=1 Tax=Kutzneria sp. (strain 744) TaxID=345341 RepID=UPI0003EEB553|nr:styrene monooxygenase/indole monooxygenase family protein [Kutzneria sp. 744]EWM11793.1 oxidoreductase [Kutzneria sp. 744]